MWKSAAAGRWKGLKMSFQHNASAMKNDFRICVPWPRFVLFGLGVQHGPELLQDVQVSFLLEGLGMVDAVVIFAFWDNRLILESVV